MKKRVEPTLPQAGDIRRIKRALLPLFPKRTRLDIEVWAGAGHAGMCWQVRPGLWKIRLNADQDDAGFQDTLIHECAHALSGLGLEPMLAHGPIWGVCYAACYRAVVETATRTPKTRKRTRQ